MLDAFLRVYLRALLEHTDVTPDEARDAARELLAEVGLKVDDETTPEQLKKIPDAVKAIVDSIDDPIFRTLADHYAPLVKRIAYHMMARLPASVEVDDLIQVGAIDRHA